MKKAPMVFGASAVRTGLELALSAQAAAPFNTEVAGSSHKEKVRSVHEKSPDGFRGFCGADGR